MDTKIHNKPNGCLWEKRMRAKNVDKKEGKEEERKKGRWMDGRKEGFFKQKKK